MLSISNREAAVCNTAFISSKHGLVLSCCVTIAKSLHFSEPIFSNGCEGTEGNALSCLSQTILKRLVLSTIFTNVSPVCEGENTAGQYREMVHITAPVVFLSGTCGLSLFAVLLYRFYA